MGPPTSYPSMKGSSECYPHHQHLHNPHHHHHHIPNSSSSGPKKKRPPRTTPKKWGSDDRSRASGDSSAATPTSVVFGAPLTRDLSDLSGSYMNGTTSHAAALHHGPTVYHSDQSATSYQRPWRQACILSAASAQCPGSPGDEAHTINMFKEKVLVGPQGLVEVIPHCDDSQDTSVTSRHHDRQPLIILLMDPGRKSYELMQLWIDVVADTVRDVLHALQLSLTDRWRQDYDGLFQARNKTFSQLIHILNVSRYDVQPMEIWVAKPWAMPAKTTVKYASTVIQYLQSLDVVSEVGLSNDMGSTKAVPVTTAAAESRAEDTVVVLSQKARDRRRVPKGGLLMHHHAYQFLSFSPSFEPTTIVHLNGNNGSMRVDVLAGDSSSDGGSQLSDSHGPSTGAAELLPNISKSIALPPGARQASEDLLPMEAVVQEAKTALRNRVKPEQSRSDTRKDGSNGPCLPVSTATRTVKILSVERPDPEPRLFETSSHKQPQRRRQGGVGRFLSAFNCTRSCGARKTHVSIRSSPPPIRRSRRASEGSPAGVETMDTATDSLDEARIWKGTWEDGDSLVSGVSESRPLLKVRGSPSRHWK